MTGAGGLDPPVLFWATDGHLSIRIDDGSIESIYRGVESLWKKNTKPLDKEDYSAILR